MESNTNINSTNYEAHLLDYLEGNISEEDRDMLFAFLDRHPELKTDLDVPIDLILPNRPLFKHYPRKNSLKKHPADEYRLAPLDYLYIKEVEEGLSSNELHEQALLEPDKKKREKEKHLFTHSILKPDPNIRLSSKSMLKRFSPIGLNHHRLQQAAAVAIVLLMAGTLWFAPRHTTNQTLSSVTKQDQSTISEHKQIAKAQPIIVEKDIITQETPDKDSLMKIANNPMGKKAIGKNKQQKAIQIKDTIKPVKLASLKYIDLPQKDSINGYEHALNVMMPQYMSNNILRRELTEIYKQIEEETTQPGNLALLESSVKVLNFFSKDDVSLDKYYDEQGNITGYNLSGNGLKIQRRGR